MNQQLQVLHLELNGLPTAAKADFEFWRELLEPLIPMQRGISARVQELADATGLPFKTLRNKLYLARQSGLIALIDKRLAGPRYWNTRQPTGLTIDDKELVKLYAGLNQRSSRSAMKQLRMDWVRKRPCAEIVKREGARGSERITALLRRERRLSESGYPVGWHVDNLARHTPTKFQLKAVRIGRSAAASE
ncbi:MAG TPA: hypothetical protein VK474_09055, partial [Chthoniobacterales bacterium]|nr:hypothetical protein [Chthoniobacterales bacterium]